MCARPASLLAAPLFSAVLASLIFPSAVCAADGDLDATFGSGGVVRYPAPGTDDQRLGLGLQTDGRIVVAAGIGGDITVLRFLADGALDGSFGTGGVVQTDLGGDDGAAGVAILPDGRILVAGRTDAMGATRFAVLRYLADGSLDVSWAGSGIATHLIGSGGAAEDVAIQADGAAVVTGSVDGDMVAARYTSAGALDAAFGVGGVATASWGAFDEARSVAVLKTAGPTCGTSLCWKVAATRSRYLDRDAQHDGLNRIVLRASSSDKSAARLVARTDAAPLPALPLAPPVTVQLHSEAGACWQTTFSDAVRNEQDRFKARAD